MSIRIGSSLGGMKISNFPTLVWERDLACGFGAVADELTRRVAQMQESPVGLHSGARLRVLLNALDRLRRNRNAAAVFDQAPQLLCGTGMFARVMVSRVQGSTWSPLALYAHNDHGPATLEIDGVVEDLHIALASPLVEAEVVRRRLPALVGDAQGEPRTHRPLITRTGTREYVVAPIVADSVVIGLLHADHAGEPVELAGVDRDLLRLYADGVGLCIECAGLRDRADRQDRILADVCATAQTLSTIDGVPELRVGEFNTKAPVRMSIPAERVRTDDHRESARLARLTSREREVLDFLASGATNAQLADRLTVAESTVKSHVKHILHKLGAANRAAAISCYLRETRAEERRVR